MSSKENTTDIVRYNLIAGTAVEAGIDAPRFVERLIFTPAVTNAFMSGVIIDIEDYTDDIVVSTYLETKVVEINDRIRIKNLTCIGGAPGQILDVIVMFRDC